VVVHSGLEIEDETQAKQKAKVGARLGWVANKRRSRKFRFRHSRHKIVQIRNGRRMMTEGSGDILVIIRSTRKIRFKNDGRCGDFGRCGEVEDDIRHAFCGCVRDLGQPHSNVRV
jgi:hypothetical protein